MKLIIYIVLFLPLFGFSQSFADKKFFLIDSLVLEDLSEADVQLINNALETYHKVENDTSKIKALNPICEGLSHIVWFKYQQHQYKLILKALNQKQTNQSKIFLLSSKSGALNNYGIYYEMQGQINKSLNAYNQSLEIDRQLKNKKGVAYTLNNIGFIYDKQGNIPKALNYYHNSLSILESLNDKYGISYTCNNIGLIYYNQGEKDKALKFHERSLQLRIEIDDKNGIANSYNNLGLIYGNSEKAIEYHKKSLKIRTEIGDKYGAAYSHTNLGKINLTMNNLEKAQTHFNESLLLREEIGDKGGTTISLKYLGEIYLKKGNKSLAKKYLEKSFSLANEMGYPEEIQISAIQLSKYYESEKKFKDALNYYKLHIQMRDSLNNEKSQKATIQQQAKYEYEKQKAIDDAEHEKQLAIEQEAKAKQKIITYSITGSLGLVVVFLIFVFNRLQVTRKQKNTIEQQKEVVEKQKNTLDKAHDELKEKSKEITDSINYAKRIQEAILPSNELLNQSLKNGFVLYQPKDIVSGDFYWIEKIQDTVYFAAADCTGHGVPGAMVSVVCSNALSKSVLEENKKLPGEILDKTREIVVERFSKNNEDVKDGMDISLCCLQFSESSTTLLWAGANNPLWIVKNNELIEIKPDKQPIGKVDNPQPFTNHTISLEKGDTIYVFTDGYADQFGGEKGKKMMYKPFKNLLLTIQDKSMSEQKNILDNHFKEWKGSLEQVDDVCIIGLRI